MMPTIIVLAPCAFKGTLDAPSVALAMAEGARLAFPEALIRISPVADGGEGMLDLLVGAMGGEFRTLELPLPSGDGVCRARWGWIAQTRMAIIESAEAVGLHLVPEGVRNPGATSTHGVGLLMKAALDAGAKRVIVGLGGTSTNDGGMGLASALGVRFLDGHGMPLPGRGDLLADVRSIDLRGLHPDVRSCSVVAACDVTNVLTGNEGATRIFAPQKGASAEMVERLEQGMENYRQVLRLTLQRDVGGEEGSGAAGGLGAALIGFCGAEVIPGIRMVLEATGFDAALDGASLVITGEGRFDGQTAHGKAIHGVAEKAKKLNVPVGVVAGSADGLGTAWLRAMGIAAVTTLVDGMTPLETAMRDARSLIVARTAVLVRELLTGRQ
jgi:glycerate 2-kinase